MGSGSRGASAGSHRCSFSTAKAYSAALGSRATISSPRWKVKLSQPLADTGRTGRPAHRGNWSRTSRRTWPVSTVTRWGRGPRSGVLLNASPRFCVEAEFRRDAVPVAAVHRPGQLDHLSRRVAREPLDVQDRGVHRDLEQLG